MKPHRPLFLVAIAIATPVVAAPTYHLTGSITLGAPERWDYAVYDPDGSRLYVAHADRLDVIDGRKAEVIGSVVGIKGGTHGTAISHATGQGFTDDGDAGTAIAFNLKTLRVTHSIKAADDADGIARDPMTGHIFVVEGDPGTITVVDPKKDAAVATITVGEKLEYAVADNGIVYAAGNGAGDVVRIDSRTNKVTARWPMPDCKSPHGLAFDAKHRRLFMGCVNALMMVVDADSGRLVATLPIGRGSDAIAFDSSRGRVFSSNGADGTITAYRQRSADSYEALDPIATKISGRTMAVDPQSGRLFVVAADTDPPAAPGARPKPRPGTLAVLVFDPAD